jgi:hypothetical protein
MTFRLHLRYQYRIRPLSKVITHHRRLLLFGPSRVWAYFDAVLLSYLLDLWLIRFS